MMDVSIIIPVYNVAPYIEDCLNSVMRQTYVGPMECILVDDCGTDDSMAVAERMITEYTGPIRFEILHHDHNRHPTKASIVSKVGDYEWSSWKEYTGEVPGAARERKEKRNNHKLPGTGNWSAPIIPTYRRDLWSH